MTSYKLLEGLYVELISNELPKQIEVAEVII